MLETYVQWLNEEWPFVLYDFDVTPVDTAVNELVDNDVYSYSDAEEVKENIAIACGGKAIKYYDAFTGNVYSVDDLKKMMEKDMNNERFINFCKEMEKDGK